MQKFKCFNIEESGISEIVEAKKELENILFVETEEKTFPWAETVDSIFDMQRGNGLFSLIDPGNVGCEERIAFCLEPTYIMTAILIKSYLRMPEIFDENKLQALSKAMKMCCLVNLEGHGYDALAGQIKALEYFMACDIKSMLDLYPQMCDRFTKMFEEIVEQFSQRVKEEKFIGIWGEDYKTEILKINDYFSQRNVFVYGTLMEGRYNHSYVSNSTFLGYAEIEGYDMYNLGHFPGIVKGGGRVCGEVYEVTPKQLADIDCLEGEGSLYIKTLAKVRLSKGRYASAFVYVYNHSVEGKPKILTKYGSDKVWYVSYGSNMLEERFSSYIRGGFCEYNKKSYSGCENKKMPVESMSVCIPYNMYYSNYGLGSWEKSSVSFLDLTKPGMAYARAYLITVDQLLEIHKFEGSTPNWYPDCVQFESINGIPAYTYAGYSVKKKERWLDVSEAYRTVLRKGLHESFPQLSSEEIENYLENCGE